MRIQHNIMAMNAYRNYTNNVSAMKKNLERLSSGYKINRAGDDAAGLAISEKMRAQITGLETAQKNAKDGISLVQTAEGALTEVHDMLNRMVELASMSANGTFDNDTDRAQLQKEVEQLKDEINRIADSANFNGIQLLDGSMDGTVADKIIADAVYKNKGSAMIETLLLDLPKAGQAPTLGVNTQLETEADGGTRPSFSIDLDGMTYTISNVETGEQVTINIGGAMITISLSSAQGFKSGDTITADRLVKEALKSITGGQVTISVSASSTTNATITFNVKVDGTRLVFEAAQAATQTINAHLDVSFGSTINNGKYTGTVTSVDVQAVAGKYVSGAYTQSGNTAAGQSVKASITLELDGKELTFEATVDESETKATTTSIMNALLNATATDEDGNEYTLGNIANITVSGTNVFVIEARVGGEYDSANAPEGLIKVMSFSITGGDSTTALADAGSDPWTDGKNGFTPGLGGSHNVGAVDIHAVGGVEPNRLANTILDLSKLDITDGMQIRLGNTTYTFAVGKDSKYKDAENVIDMTDYEEYALTHGGGDGQVMAVSRLTEAAAKNDTFSVGQAVSADGSLNAQITLQQLESVKDSTDMTTMEKLISYIGIATVDKAATAEAQAAADAANEAAAAKVGKALTLQIGDTADSYNQLRVNIKDCHTGAIGVEGISIADQESAQAAVDAIKAAINYVSDVRGTLGATQNRLDHTINNLSVMTENIQDAESTIRDTDIAEEMMAYTKNNILIQSAQAMLAQANQVPQGVLQLLQ